MTMMEIYYKIIEAGVLNFDCHLFPSSALTFKLI